MRGIVLAGGTGSRLAPLTLSVNKHLLPVGGEPMIFHSLRQLAGAGVHEVLLITGPEHIGQIATCVGSGERFGLEISYRIQAEPGGIAEALALAEGFSRGDNVAVMLGDNIFAGDLAPFIQSFGRGDGARVLLKKVEDPRRYGVATLEGDKVVAIEEKPENPSSDMAVVGLYLFDAQVFRIIPNLHRSARGELEISDVNAEYLRRGQLSYGTFGGDWTDAGTLPSYRIANEMLCEYVDGQLPSRSGKAKAA